MRGPTTKSDFTSGCSPTLAAYSSTTGQSCNEQHTQLVQPNHLDRRQPEHHAGHEFRVCGSDLLRSPFNSNANYAAPIGSKAAGAEFKDTWTLSDVDVEWINLIEARHPTLHRVLLAAMTDSDKSYLVYMAARLLEMRRLLKPTGSIYLHCDPTMSHYLKLIMDAVFGKPGYKNEVIWRRTGAHGRAKRWGPIHDTILFYTNSKPYTWNRTYQAYDPEYVQKFYSQEDDYGCYQPVALSGPGIREGSSGSPWRDRDPSVLNRHWELPPDRALPSWIVATPPNYSEIMCQERLDVLDRQGLIVWSNKPGAIPRYKRYLSVAPGNAIQDIIWDIRPISSRARERVGYPTQKPLALLDRIIQASSKENDVVLDPSVVALPLVLRLSLSTASGQGLTSLQRRPNWFSLG